MAMVANAEKWLHLLEDFNAAVRQGELDRYRERRWGKAETMAQWLAQESLTTMSTEQGIALYRASGGTRITQFRSNPIAELRDSLDFLLYDTNRLEARFDECADDEGGTDWLGRAKSLCLFYFACEPPLCLAPGIPTPKGC